MSNSSQLYPIYDPTAGFAGEGPYHHRPVSIGAAQNASGGVLPRLTLLGCQSASGVAEAAGTNTGNGALTLDPSTPALPNVKAGVYVVKFTSATAYNVYDPSGDEIGQGVNGAAFADRVKFNTAAGNTPFVAGDTFNITVSNPDTYVVSKATAIDGSQIPSAILAADTDTSGGAVQSPSYFTGAFTYEEMNVDPSWSLTALRAAIRQNNIQLFIKSADQLG